MMIDNKYRNLTLSELEREVLNSDNDLAKALLDQMKDFYDKAYRHGWCDCEQEYGDE